MITWMKLMIEMMTWYKWQLTCSSKFHDVDDNDKDDDYADRDNDRDDCSSNNDDNDSCKEVFTFRKGVQFPG